MQEFIYCFSTADPGVCKICTSKVPLLTLQFACLVQNATEQLSTLQRVLDRYVPALGDGLYRLSLDEVIDFLSLVGTPMEEASLTEPEGAPEEAVKGVVYSWDMKNFFTEGQSIRHCIATHHTLIAEYRNGKVEYFGRTFLSLREFARYHYRNFSPYWTENDFLNGWYECECKVDGEWRPVYTIADPLIKTNVTNGQRVRHCVGEHIWIGTYDNGSILVAKKIYSSLSQFTVSHLYKAKAAMDAAQRLEAEVRNEWYPIFIAVN